MGGSFTTRGTGIGREYRMKEKGVGEDGCVV